MLERARQFARNAWFLLRYCTVGVPLSVEARVPPPLEHEWRAVLGVDRWDYLYRGERFATIYRLTESEIDDLGHEGMGFKRWPEGFRIEWERGEAGWGNERTYCGTFDMVRQVCRIHAEPRSQES
jgi:hypothetical protein